MMDLSELAVMLERSAVSAREKLAVDLSKIGEVTREAARTMIGHEMPEWPPLAAQTVADKAKLGFTGRVSATDPLLREGTLRDSISFEVEPSIEGISMAVGSTDKVALYQEMGTTRIPPRPFLSLATIETLPYATRKLVHTAESLLSPTPTGFVE